MSSSVVETFSSITNECEKSSSSTSVVVGDEGQEDDVSNNENFQQQQQQAQKQIIRYSTSTLFALRSSKLSQQKPACKNMELSCMAHYKPPPKMLIANMMPKFALNQMPNRGEESISPLSFHSNSSSSSNLSYQKRYQEGGIANGQGGSGQTGDYANSRYYYNKYKSHDEIGGVGGSGSNNGPSRIIYKTTGANSSNSIRFLKKAYSNKYEEHEASHSIGLISNKNILGNSSRVITSADHRNLKKKMLDDDEPVDDDKGEKKSPADEANNNSKVNDKDCERGKLSNEVNANDLMSRNDLNKKRPDDITNQLDDMFNDLSLNQLLDDKITEERESSRFSKWFSRDNDEVVGGKHEHNNNNNNNARLFHETEKYFQPIDKMEHNSSLFDMLKGNQSDPMVNNMQSPISQPKPQKSPGNSGQIHSVEELEAKLRHHKSEEEQKGENERKVLQNFFQQQLMPNLIHQQQQQQQQQAPQMPHSQNQDEINAFKKLLSQMAADEHVKVPMMMTPNGQQQQQQQQQGPNMLQQLMNKNFQQDIMIQQQFQKTFPGQGQGIKSPGGNTSGKMMNHMIPQQAFGGNLDMKFLQQQQQQQQKMPAAIPEIVKRPEIQALVQELTSGEISQYNLWQRLTAPGLSPIEREIITCALNIFNANSNNGNAASLFAKQPHNLFPPPPTQANTTSAAATQRNFLTAPIPIPPQASPLSPVPPIDQHLLFQHQAAVAANKQLRLSPLPAGFSMGPAVLPPNNTLSLHVPGMPQRIPSPRELQYHTQSIMQNALIRKKLEEQRENYRKRQEQEKQENAKKNQQETSSDGSMNSDQGVTTIAPSISQEEKPPQPESPTKKAPIAQSQLRQHAPSPSIFTLTPTSVLRKMTGEKDNDAAKNEKKKLLAAMPAQSQQHQQAAMRNPQQQSQQPPFMGNIGTNSMSQMDRLKMSQSDAGMQFAGINWNSPPHQDMKPIGRPIVKSSTVPGPQQQQQQQANAPSGMMNNFDFQQQQKMQNIQKAQFLQMQMKKQQMDNPVLSQFMAQQQQRAVQAQSQFRQFPQQQQPMNFPMMQSQSGRPEKPEEQLESRNMMNNGGCLSPTSNQLAKWFSPELLADASAGKLLPSMSNVSGQMMSLEELEKCMQNS